MFYKIDSFFDETTYEQCNQENIPFIGIVSNEEFKNNHYGMNIDRELDVSNIFNSKVESNGEALTGTLFVPDRKDMNQSVLNCGFAIDSHGILFIDDQEKVLSYIQNIRKTKKHQSPSLERFLYDFLESLIEDDLQVLETCNEDMELIETNILDGQFNDVMSVLTHIRNQLRLFWGHYEQLIDIGEKLEENENDLFDENNLKYFKLFVERLDRRQNLVSSLRDHTAQIRDLYQSQLDVRQNKTMTVLTVVTTIFLPLTLIAGWYGMNFKYMPELGQSWGYPGVIILCIIIIVFNLWFFKKKNLL